MHSNIRHKCKLCQNDTTLKSLMNHVRKYRTGIRGKKCLASFLSKSQQNLAVFHVCHICNHKFKKQIDRDRHLFIRNIVNNANVSHCTLCDYTAARKSYLEAHHRKHRLVYVCCVCNSMFLSSIKLREHLQEHLSVAEENRNFSVAQAGKEMHPNNVLLQITSETCTIRKMTDSGDINADKTSSTQSSCDGNFKENEGYFRKPANNNQDQNVSIHDITSAYSEISETSDAHTLSSLISNYNIPTSETGDICHLTVARRQRNSQSCATQGPSDLNYSMTSEITTSECNKTKEEISSAFTRETLFDASINQSWYLHEPDGTLAFNQYVNIPEELIEGQTNLNQEDIQNNDESLRIEEINKESLTETEPGSETKQQSALDTIIALNYKPLTMDIYIKIRQSFGEFECDFCGRLFHVHLDLESHRLKHVDEKPYKCDKCPYSAGTKENLKSHQETNHEGRTYPCDQCGFVATSRTSLWHHRQKHLSNLLCQICQKAFTNIRNLRDHIVSLHPNVEKEEISKLLGKNRQPVGRLGRRSYKCPYCSKIFHHSSADLQKHIWIHEGVKPYKCDVCSYSCRSRNNLNVHMLRHTAEKPHHCDECGKSYKSKTALRCHIKTHTQNSFVCDHCEYTTSETSEMQKHMKTHEQLQLCLCESCSFSSDNLNANEVHYLQQHQETIMNEKSVIAISADSLELDFPEKMYKCLSCSCVFKTTAETRQHLEVQHGILLENMDFCGGTVGGIEVMPESVIMPISTPQDILQENSTNNSLPQEIQMVELQDADNESFPSLLKNLQLPNLAPVTKANDSASSALNIIHQVIHQEGMDSSGLALHAVDGDRLIAVDPDTFIIQEDGQQLVVNGTDTQNQYVIQYVTQAATNSDPSDIIASDIIGESKNELQFEIHCNKDIQLVGSENNQNVDEILTSCSIIERHEL